ncbi:MAG: hypothetical protein ACRC7N_21900 [Clostridium sp.]
MKISKIKAVFLITALSLTTIGTINFSNASNVSENKKDTVKVQEDNSTTDIRNYIEENSDKIDKENPTKILRDYMKDNGISSISKSYKKSS